LDVCLARELREELDVEARVGGEIHAVTHRYDDRDVELHFFECELTRDPRPQLGQNMRWVPLADLQTLQFPPADAELIGSTGYEVTTPFNLRPRSSGRTRYGDEVTLATFDRELWHAAPHAGLRIWSEKLPHARR
jgi:NUDIX domain